MARNIDVLLDYTGHGLQEMCPGLLTRNCRERDLELTAVPQPLEVSLQHRTVLHSAARSVPNYLGGLIG